MKRMILVHIAFLIVGLCLISMIAAPPLVVKADGNSITVDDEGDGDYTSIKEALNYSNPGDTIEVYSGIYYEHGIEIHT